jgi:hypothetical protein
MHRKQVVSEDARYRFEDDWSFASDFSRLLVR